MKKFLHLQKSLFALLLALFLGMGTSYAADFSATCSTGQTLYYNITDATNHYVEITYPGTSSSSPWEGYTKPTGNITLPSSVSYNGTTYAVKAIGYAAFDGCIGLTGSLNLPNSLTSIGNNAFRNCSGLTGNLIIPNSVTTINSQAFKDCSGLTSLNLPNSLTSIGTGVFRNCSGLTGNLLIPNSLTTINPQAFMGCGGLTSLTLPASVTSIGFLAFSGCEGLTTMTVFSQTPPSLGDNVFNNVPTDISVYVPCESWEDYQAASGWSDFTNMQCLETLTVYDGTDYNNRIPANIYNFNYFTRSQFVVPAADLMNMRGKPISSMTFYTARINVPYTTVSNADVYLMEVDYTTISAYEPQASATVVYSGLFSIVSTDGGGEMTINFSTPYVYQGGNLLVGIDNTEANGYKEIYFKGQTVNGASIWGANVSSTGTISASQQDFIPKTSFVYAPSMCAPKTLPYTYDFEEEDEFECWTMLDCEEYSGRTTFYHHDGDYGFRFFYYTNLPQYLISPELKGTTGMDVSFYYKNYSNDHPESFQVGYSTTTQSLTAFTWGDEVTAQDEDNWMLYEESFPEGTKYIAVKYNSNDQVALFLDDFSFTPSICPKPKRLTATDIISNSATLQWTGFQDDYDLRYRKKPLFFEDFENGQPSDWTTIDNDGDGYDWFPYSSAYVNVGHSGTGIMESASWYQGIVLTPDNWLITPQLDLRGTMKVWLRANSSSYPDEHFAIYLSTTGNSVSDFTIELVPETVTSSEYVCYTADLNAYVGQQGYIAIRHFNCTDMDRLRLDDFGIFNDPDETGEWVTLYEVGSSYTLSDLESATSYEWQVKGHDCDEWSKANIFTTICQPEDQCELTFTLTDSYGDGWNGNAIRVVDAETGDVLATMTNVTNDHANAPITETYTIAVCNGRTLLFEWMSGNYDSECSYVVTDANGTEIFSGSGAMSAPVTYTVNCGGGQTIELVAGYNWVSTYIDGDPFELLEALQDGLGDNGVSIEGPEGINENLGDGFWWGDLDYVGINSGTMYLILVEEDCEVNLTGTPVSPSLVMITINPGYNWIGFTGTEEVEVEAALAGFEAEDGDAIEGPEGMTEYLGDGMWWGDFDTFVPGQGYMYNSASGEVKTFFFQTGGSKARVIAVSQNKTKNVEKPSFGIDNKQ